MIRSGKKINIYFRMLELYPWYLIDHTRAGFHKMKSRTFTNFIMQILFKVSLYQTLQTKNIDMVILLYQLHCLLLAAQMEAC